MATCNPHFIERAACPCCQSADFDTLYDCSFDEDPVRQYLKDFYDPRGGVQFEQLRGARYGLRHCRNCTLIYQAQIGDEFLLQLLYERWLDPALARKRDEERCNLQHLLEYAREIVTVLAYLGKLPAETRVLDFGMGWGRWCRMARGFGCEAFGTELSHERSEFARSQGVGVVSWDEIPGQNFDFINTEQVFEHLAKPLETLQHLVSGLSHDGLLKISVPNGKRIPSLLKQPDWTAPKGSRKSLNPVAPLEHINCFNHGALVSLAQQAKLTLVPMSWSTQIEVVPKRFGFCRLQSRLRRLERAAKALVRSLSPHESGTYLFFRKSGSTSAVRSASSAMLLGGPSSKS